MLRWNPETDECYLQCQTCGTKGPVKHDAATAVNQGIGVGFHKRRLEGGTWLTFCSAECDKDKHLGSNFN